MHHFATLPRLFETKMTNLRFCAVPSATVFAMEPSRGDASEVPRHVSRRRPYFSFPAGVRSGGRASRRDGRGGWAHVHKGTVGFGIPAHVYRQKQQSPRNPTKVTIGLGNT